jgi:hypothetical protein
MARPKRTSIVNVTKEEYNYVKPDSIDEDLCCSICHDIFDTVKRIKRCKHLFCYACILQSLSQNKSCPICRTYCTENDLQYAAKIQSDLDQLIVYCNFSPDCDWEGKRKDLKSHLQVSSLFFIFYFIFFLRDIYIYYNSNLISLDRMSMDSCKV